MYTRVIYTTSFQPFATPKRNLEGVAYNQTEEIKTNKQKTKMINDIFDNVILCNKCGKKMGKAQIIKNGFVLRLMVCPNVGCNEKIIHPVDEQEYHRFINLKNKEFKVKMRLVGNSYAVSIPKEIVSFMNEQKSIMDEMVKLCFEDFGRLSLNFEEVKRKK